MNRRVALMLPIAVMAMGLAACGSDENSGPKTVSDAGLLQVRPVLKVVAKKDAKCATPAPVVATLAATIVACDRDGRSIKLGPAVLTARDIESVGAEPGFSGKDFQVTINLNAAGTTRLRTVTGRAVAQPAPENALAFMIDDTVNSVVEVQSQITGGQLQLVGLSEAEAVRIADELTPR